MFKKLWTSVRIASSLIWPIKALEKIEKHQEEEIKKKGSGGAQKFAIIFDDVVGHVKLMNSPEFIGAFIKVEASMHTSHRKHFTHTLHTP